MAELRESFAVSVVDASLLAALSTTRAEFEETAKALLLKLEKGLRSAEEAHVRAVGAMAEYRRASIQESGMKSAHTYLYVYVYVCISA